MFNKKLSVLKVILFFALSVSLQACYKLEDLTPNYEDGVSTIIYDLPGDTLATDGWDAAFESKDLYLRQRFYNSPWTDSIRFVPYAGEQLNAARGVDIVRGSKTADEWFAEVLESERKIRWLASSAEHPTAVQENDAYANTGDGYHYIRRHNSWYQMEIAVDSSGTAQETLTVDWRGFMQQAPANPQNGYAYRNNRNNRVYFYNGKAWELLARNANYRQNINFVEVQFGKSGKEAGIYSPFLFRFSDKWHHFLRDNADSVRFLRTDEWDLAFTGDFNSMIYLNNGRARLSPATGSPITKSSLIMYEYGYEFMNEAPDDEFFDNRPADMMQIGFESQYGAGINSWYQIGGTSIAKPFPNRAYYLRLEQPDGSYLYGKLQLISMYKGSPDVLTDANWPSPYLTFRYFIQQDGTRNVRTRD